MAEETRQKRYLVREYLVYALVFLFPIAGVSVRHWYSAIFVALALFALAICFQRVSLLLLRGERLWLWLCAGFFASFVLSSLLAGWGADQSRSLGVDIRFLLVVPLYLMLRRYPQSWLFLLAGTLVSGLVLAGQSWYDLNMLKYTRAQGIYSPNLLGPVAVLAVMAVLVFWHRYAQWRWLLFVVALFALYAVMASGSRGALVGLMLMMFAWVLIALKRWQYRVMAVSLAVFIPLVAYVVFDAFANRVDVAVVDTVAYLSDHSVLNENGGETAAVRFEMWRAAILVFQDSPFFGVGGDRYVSAITPYVETGLVHAQVLQHSHPHSAYFEVLMSRGLVGIFLFLTMLFYPLYFFARTARQSPDTAHFGLLFVVAFAAFSLTDASTILKGNFVSIYLLYMATLMSSHAAMVSSGKRAQ